MVSKICWARLSPPAGSAPGVWSFGPETAQAYNALAASNAATAPIRRIFLDEEFIVCFL
jgi:hypothetical protein